MTKKESNIKELGFEHPATIGARFQCYAIDELI